MSVMVEKRGYNTEEAMAYLGLKRRTFEQHIAPRCKGTRIGTSKVWERAELDAAWEQYKIDTGSKRPEEKGENRWDAEQPASIKQKPDMKLINTTKVSAFANAASAILKRPKHG